MYKSILRMALLFWVFLSVNVAHAENLKIKVGMEGNYPPLDYMLPDGTHAGFEVDLLKALCAKLGADCKIVTQEFAGLLTSLQTGKLDIALAGISITDERKQKVLFSDSYYKNSNLYIGAKSMPAVGKDLSNLKNTVIGVQEATVLADYADKYLSPVGAEIKIYGSVLDMELDLANGRLDYMLLDHAIANDFFKANGKSCCDIKGVIENIFDEVAIAISKKHPELVPLFNSALIELKKDGTYQTIYNKYFN